MTDSGYVHVCVVAFRALSQSMQHAVEAVEGQGRALKEEEDRLVRHHRDLKVLVVPIVWAHSGMYVHLCVGCTRGKAQ